MTNGCALGKVTWGGFFFCFVFWKVTELLENISNRNVNSMLTVPFFFLSSVKKRERRGLKMKYKATTLEVTTGIILFLHRFLKT